LLILLSYLIVYSHGNPSYPRKNTADGRNALTMFLPRLLHIHVLLMQLHKLLCYTMLQKWCKYGIS